MIYLSKVLNKPYLSEDGLKTDLPTKYNGRIVLDLITQKSYYYDSSNDEFIPINPDYVEGFKNTLVINVVGDANGSVSFKGDEGNVSLELISINADKLDGLDSSQFLRNDIDDSINGDIEFTNENKGIILVDRSDTSKKYRLFIDNGNLGIEEV